MKTVKTNFIVTDEHKVGFFNTMLDLSNRFYAGSINPEITIDNLQLVAEGAKLSAEFPEQPKWIRDLLATESKYHLKFFGQEFDLTEFAGVLKKYGQRQLKRWQKLGLEPHFLPKVSLMIGDEYPGWKVKPNKWFYEQLLAGRIFRSINNELKKVPVAELEGITVLIDTRLKPAYQNSKQMYQDDNLLGPIIKQLREQERIVGYEPIVSRFNISANETEAIKPLLVQKLGLNQNQVRLELAIEANIIPQLYSDMPRKNDGKSDIWVWYEEYFDDYVGRLGGGNSDSGGLANVGWNDADNNWDCGSVRFLAVL